MEASLYIDDEYVDSEYGEIQFTSFGISGIPIMNLSRYVKEAIVNDKEVSIITFNGAPEQNTLALYHLQKYLIDSSKNEK